MPVLSQTERTRTPSQMPFRLLELQEDLLLCVLDATLVGMGHVALEQLSATCRALRALRTDPGVVLRLCDAHGAPARTRERFHPGPRSLCTAEGFYRRLVSPEYALRTDAEFECAVVAGDVDRMSALLALGASVHVPDYARLKQESRRRRTRFRDRPTLRRAACHANGYRSDEADMASPLLQRAALCGHVGACQLLLRAAGNLPPESTMPFPDVEHWGACRGLHPSQKRWMCERNELNDAAASAYEHDRFATLECLLDAGALVEPAASHDAQVWWARVRKRGADWALRQLFRVAKPDAKTMSSLLEACVLERGRVAAARELLAHGAALVPFDGIMDAAWFGADLALFELLLPALRSVPENRACGWGGVDGELAEGLAFTCHHLVEPTASRAAHLAMALRLLDEGASPVHPAAAGPAGSPLVLACQAGEAALVQRFLDAGVPPDVGDGLPMTFALAQNHVEVVRLLNDAMVPVLNKRLRTSHE